MSHSTPPAARCIRAPFDEVECRIPFDADLIAAWKREIPYSRRSYEPRAKAWRFWGGFEDLALALLLERFPDADLPRGNRTRAEARTRRAESDPFAILHLRPTAPPELIAAAYRTLAKLHHPDVGGDAAIMRRLTEAHDALSRRLSA